MSKIFSPRIVQDGLVMCLDASQNKSYPAIDLPVKNGLNLWLDASDDTTFSYSSGTEVSQWRDKSGNNLHANQSTTSVQPTRSTTNNSRKSVNFVSANGDCIQIPSGVVLPGDASIFIVHKPGVQSYNYAVIIDNNHSGPGQGFVIQRVNNLSQFYYANGNGSSFTDTSSSPWIYTDNTIQLISLNKNSTTGIPYTNGTAQTTRTLNATTYQASTLLNIGVWTSGGRYYNGEICEIIIFNRALNSNETKQVHTYLGQKWGILNTDRSIIDLSGNDDNGLLGNGTTANMPLYDYYNKGSLVFDGSVDYITVPSSAAIKNSLAITLEAWVYITNTTSYYAGIIGKGTSDADEEYCLLINSVGSKVYMDVGSGGGPYTDITFSFSTNTWYHVVGTHERLGGSSNLKIYINGSLLSGTTVNPTNTVNSNTTNVTIGSRYNTGASPWNGKIANAKIYNRTLTASEVSQNYEAQKSKFANTIVQQGLVLNLDAGNPYSYAGAGTTWYDVSGAVNDFAITNSPTYSVNQFILNGSTQFFSNLSAASGFFISSTNNFYADVGYAWTISVWFKFPVSPTNLRDATNNGGNCSYCIVGNGGGIGGAETLALFVSGVSGTTAGFHPYYCVVGVRGAKTQLSISSVNTNTWNNVVVTWNGSAGRGYFNGVDRGALNIGSAGMQINGYTIGTQVGGNQGSHTYEGSLSQVFIYNRAISAAEVLQNYEATKGVFGL